MIDASRGRPRHCAKRGNAHLREGELAEAAECYREAIAADPADANAYVSLGFALRELQQLGDAEAALQRAVALDPEVADAHYLLGTLARARNAPDEAIGHLRRAVEVQPDLDVAYHELFTLLFRSGQLAEAQEVIGRAIARWPQAAELRCYLGNLLSQRGEYAQAAASYREAVAIAPELPGAHNDLGCALEKLDQLERGGRVLPAGAGAAAGLRRCADQPRQRQVRQAKLAEAQVFMSSDCRDPKRAEGIRARSGVQMQEERRGDRLSAGISRGRDPHELETGSGAGDLGRG